MPILVNCDVCGKGYRLKDEFAGREIPCKECGSPIAVPGEGAGSRRVEPRSRPRPVRRRRVPSNLDPVLAMAGGGLAVVALIVVAVVLLTRGGSVASWQTFSPPGGRLEVRMPGTPKEKTKTHFGIAAKQYTVELGGKRRYGVAYADLPFAVAAWEAESRLDGGVESSVLGFSGGRIVNRKSVSLGGHPGREIDIEAGGQKSRRRLFLTGATLVVQQVDWLGDEPAADVQTFFDSLKIGSSPANEISSQGPQPGAPRWSGPLPPS